MGSRMDIKDRDSKELMGEMVFTLKSLPDCNPRITSDVIFTVNLMAEELLSRLERGEKALKRYEVIRKLYPRQ